MTLTTRARRPQHPLRRGAATALLTVAATACGGAPAALGPSTSAARANARDLLGAFAERFGPVHRTAALSAIRPRLVRYTLSPSGIYGDPEMWTGARGARRTLAVAGTMRGGRYTLDVRPEIPTPARPGDTRHLMHLTQLAEGEYMWDSTDELAAGAVRSSELAATVTRALDAAEGRPAGDVRMGYRRALPRTTVVLGRLFTLDTLRVTPRADGTSMLTLGAALRPERLKGSAPDFAAYLEKYMPHVRYRFTLVDRAGTPWLETTLRDQFLTARLRTRDGALLPLDGPPKPRPDTFDLRIAFFARALVFDVGVTELVAEVSTVRDEHALGWLLRFRREPEWHLPLISEAILRTPLGRPFEGEGAWVRFWMRDSAGAQTILQRDMHIVLRESAIVRWLGGLGTRAMSDVTRRVELQKDRFIADVFTALRADLTALLGPVPSVATP